MADKCKKCGACQHCGATPPVYPVVYPTTYPVYPSYIYVYPVTNTPPARPYIGGTYTTGLATSGSASSGYVAPSTTASWSA